MKKIFLFITISALLLGLISYLFNLGRYDWQRQFRYIEQLNFINPIDELRNLINDISKIGNWGDMDVAWYEYIPMFFAWLGSLLWAPFQILIDIFKNLFYGIQAILFLLGFQFTPINW